MVERLQNLIVARKDYTPFPINAIGLFKPKDLYLLAGMYLSSEYHSDASYLYTNITVHQLSTLTRTTSCKEKSFLFTKSN